MSNMLREAIVDAKALRESALKNAESVVIEKYSDEVRKTFNLSQIKLLVVKRSAAKLTRFRQATAIKAAQRCAHSLNRRPPAMDMKLSNILPGKTRWTGKPQHQTIVQRLPAIRIAQ